MAVTRSHRRFDRMRIIEAARARLTDYDAVLELSAPQETKAVRRLRARSQLGSLPVCTSAGSGSGGGIAPASMFEAHQLAVQVVVLQEGSHRGGEVPSRLRGADHDYQAAIADGGADGNRQAADVRPFGHSKGQTRPQWASSQIGSGAARRRRAQVRARGEPVRLIPAAGNSRQRKRAPIHERSRCAPGPRSRPDRRGRGPVARRHSPATALPRTGLRPHRVVPPRTGTTTARWPSR